MDYISPGGIYQRLMSAAFFDGKDVYAEYFTEDYYCSPHADNLILSYFVFCALRVLCFQEAQKSKFCEFTERFKLDCTGDELDQFLKEIESALIWVD